MQKPKIGLLALTLEFYEKRAKGLREDREKWLRSSIIPAIEDVVKSVDIDNGRMTIEAVKGLLSG